MDGLAKLAVEALERAVVENREERERGERELDAARARARQLLERADQLGVSRTRFIELSGISRTQIYRIVNERRADAAGEEPS